MKIKRLVIGNWKMNGSFAENQTLITELKIKYQGYENAEIAVCPPFVYFEQVRSILAGCKIGLGCQNVSEYNNGAFTGEVSVNMLLEFGVKYCLIGHSERRTIFKENDLDIAKKCAKLLPVGIIPVLCIGETLAEREFGKTDEVVLRQLKTVVDYVGISSFAKVVIAYEPVWAIGTGKTATPEMAEAVHKMIRDYLATENPEIAKKVQILYGGSVKGDNAQSLFSMPNINGGLIGGASLKAKDFLAIVNA